MSHAPAAENLVGFETRWGVTSGGATTGTGGLFLDETVATIMHGHFAPADAQVIRQKIRAAIKAHAGRHAPLSLLYRDRPNIKDEKYYLTYKRRVNFDSKGFFCNQRFELSPGGTLAMDLSRFQSFLYGCKPAYEDKTEDTKSPDELAGMLVAITWFVWHASDVAAAAAVAAETQAWVENKQGGSKVLGDLRSLRCETGAVAVTKIDGSGFKLEHKEGVPLKLHKLGPHGEVIGWQYSGRHLRLDREARFFHEYCKLPEAEKLFAKYLDKLRPQLPKD